MRREQVTDDCYDLNLIVGLSMQTDNTLQKHGFYVSFTLVVLDT